MLRSLRLSYLFSFLLLFFCLLVSSACTKHKQLNWWMWTPGGHVDDSTQSSFDHGYHPKQPVAKFSHQLHVEKREMDCTFCHVGAYRSITAGIPYVSTCMGCHTYVKTDSEDIKFIKEKFEKNEPIEWTKVNALPDYVRFSHRIHLNAKDMAGNQKLQCQTCHGPVEKMTTVAQWAPLQMGWCLDCHNQPANSVVGNLASNASGPGNMKDNKPASHQNARTACFTCHF